ncbi:MAG TPA: YciI family protein [Herpetosiphonaceae bacterium]
MNHFLVEITYLVPLERIDELLPGHRAFLQEGYDRGLLLLSGPQNPRVGGIVVARAESFAELDSFFAGDPYRREGVAEYRFVEFSPVKFQPLVADWIGGA